MKIESAVAGKRFGDDAARETGVAAGFEITFGRIDDSGEGAATAQGHTGATWQSENGKLRRGSSNENGSEGNSGAGQIELECSAGLENDSAEVHVAGDVED